VGKTLFGALVIFQTIMVSLLTPAFTSGAITSEREHKTYDLLMTTLLPARSVILGKLGSALAYVVLLLLALIPLESLTFMFGGVSPEEVILSQVTMFMAAVLFASIGIFWSSAVRTSVGSNVLTYGTILFLLIGLPLLYWSIVSIIMVPQYGSNIPVSQRLDQQPWFFYLSGIILSMQPLVAMAISEGFLNMGHSLFVYTTKDFMNGRDMLIVSPWLVFCIEALILSLILVAFSIRMVRPIRYTKAQGSAAAAQSFAPVGPTANLSNDAGPPPEADSVMEELPEAPTMQAASQEQAPVPGQAPPGG
jgi:hypothetical protein